MEVGDNFLERTHDFVQWIFPLKEPSMHNAKAPLLDDETIEAMKNSPECMANLILAAERFMKFYGPENKERPWWVTPRNHNYLRITRIIKCYRLFGLEDIAEQFYDMAIGYYFRFPEIIGEVTLEFWENVYAENDC